MITGFNTDIEHDGVVYHVQTEDKGLDTPIILSLVYTGGTILASKRAPYQDLIAEGFSDEVLAERLKRQHKLICAAIHSGRIDDLKKMSTRRSPEVPGVEAPVEPSVVAHEPVEEIVVAPAIADSDIAVVGGETSEFIFDDEDSATRVLQVSHDVSGADTGEFELEDEASPTPRVEVSQEGTLRDSSEFILEDDKKPTEEFQVVRDEAFEDVFEIGIASVPSQVWTPPEKVEPPPPPPPPEVVPLQESPHDKAYTVHDSRGQSLVQESTLVEGLNIILLDEAEFYAGEYRVLRVLVVDREGDDEKPLGNIAISIKILGTAFRPLIYSLKTDREGVASVATQMPVFTSGRAAVLVRAVAKDQAAELRKIIHPVK